MILPVINSGSSANFERCAFAGSSGVAFGVGTTNVVGALSIEDCTFTCGTGMELTGNHVSVLNSLFNCATRDLLIGSTSGTQALNNVLVDGNIFLGANIRLIECEALTISNNAFSLTSSETGIDCSGLTDVNLNGKRSLGLIDRLHGAPETNHIPIVTLSALDLSEIQTEARARGAIASLEKPIRLQTLLDVIREHTNPKK